MVDLVSPAVPNSFTITISHAKIPRRVKSQANQETRVMALSTKMHSTSLKHKSHCQPRQVHTSREFNKQSKVHTVVTKLNRQTAEIKHKANCSMCQEKATQSDLCPKSKA